MRRECSPWRGLCVGFFAELFDHLTNVRIKGENPARGAEEVIAGRPSPAWATL
jgi:hypothetical protein